MEDIIFYWVAWIFWVWITWIMAKNKMRTRLGIITLLAMIFSSYDIAMFHFLINGGVIFFLCLSIYLLATEPFVYQIYLCLTSLMISLGYISLILFSIYDPAWLIVSLPFIAAVYLSMICTFFSKKLNHQLINLFLSVTIGEIGLGIILNEIGLYNEIGTDGFLTRLTLAIVGIMLIFAYKQFVNYMDRMVHKLKVEKRNVI